MVIHSFVSHLVPKVAYSSCMDSTERERQFLRFCSEGEACRYLATKVRQARRAARMSQVELAKQAQVPLRTYKRFETHGKGSLQTFMHVLRALGRTQYLLMLFMTGSTPAPRETVEEKLKRMRLRGSGGATSSE